MAGAAELHAYGARETALASVTRADADLTRQADRNAMVSGLSAGLSSVTAGLTVWGVLLLGVAALGFWRGRCSLMPLDPQHQRRRLSLTGPVQRRGHRKDLEILGSQGALWSQ